MIKKKKRWEKKRNLRVQISLLQNQGSTGTVTVENSLCSHLSKYPKLKCYAIPRTNLQVHPVCDGGSRMTSTCRQKHLPWDPYFITSLCLGKQPVAEPLCGPAVTRPGLCAVSSSPSRVEYQLHAVWAGTVPEPGIYLAVIAGKRLKQDSLVETTMSMS